MTRCPFCGADIETRFRFCPYCGVSLVDTSMVQDVRKVVTIVFSDLAGSTALGEKLDSESLREVIRTYFEAMQAALERHGGTVEKFIGDAVMAVFGIPHAHEDDGLRAVRAAKDMQATLAALNDDLDRRWGVRLTARMGVNTGEVVAGDVTTGQRLVTGDAVNTAARLEQNAPPNQILISESTLALVRDMVEIEVVEPLELKGKAERFPAFRLIGVRGDTSPIKRVDQALVGRDAELGRLQSRFRAAADERLPQLATVIGDPGLGKSRLVREFLSGVDGEARVMEGTCLSYGDGITFWPLAEAIRAAAGIGDDDTPEEARGRLDALVGASGHDVAERLAAALGLSTALFPLDDTVWALRKLVAHLAVDGPVVLVVDDVHWAEATLLDLLERTLGADGELPLLIVCAARPEFLEKHSEWGEPGERTDRVILEPLSSSEEAVVASNLLGGTELPSDLVDGIARAASGNPLFVEQVVSMMIDQGALIAVDGAWSVAPGAAPVVPPSINALLAARLDALGDAERGSLQRGSVIGLDFAREAVEELMPVGREAVEGNLQTLAAKRLVARSEPIFGGDAYRFANGMVRETAYAALLKKARAEMHEGYAEWLQQQAGVRVLEYEEILGYHFEQSFIYRSELGPLDDHGRAIGHRAAELLGSAGKRALGRGDIPAAANLLDRAVAPLDRLDPLRLELVPDLAEALSDGGDLDRAGELLEDAIAGAGEIGDEVLRAHALLARLYVRFWADPEGWRDQALKETAEAITTFERLDDPLGAYRVWRLLTNVHGMAGQYTEAEHAAGEALRYANAMGAPDKAAATASSFAMAALFGRTPVDQAIPRCEQALEDSQGDRRSEGVVLTSLAHLLGLAGRFERARELYARGRALYEDLGDRILAASTSLDSGKIELVAGDLDAAERELRPDFETLTDMGEQFMRPMTATLLGQVLLRQGKLDEAADLATVCEEGSASDDTDNQIMWRRLRARVEAERGAHEDAARLAREATDLAATTEAVMMQAEAWMDLAAVLKHAGETQEAEAALARALELCTAKGASAASAYVRRTYEEA